MVQGTMVLFRAVQIGTLYKLLRSIITYGCNNIVVHENQTYITPTLSVKNLIL
jgi:hypothetical protein